jgi:hypothetical protein
MEAEIERNLWSEGGKWNIERLDVKQVCSNHSNSYEATVYNCGSYSFKNDGSGSFTITVDGNAETGALTYVNTKDQLTFIINNVVRFFDMDWTKNNLTISITENYTSNEEFITYTKKLTLRKK